MGRQYFRAIVVVLVLSSASLALAFSTGGTPGSTGAVAIGAMPAEGNCGCHTGGVYTASLRILDLPATYQPDSVYAVRVRISKTGPSPTRGGFQLTAVRSSDGQGVGTFDLTGTFGMQVVSGAGAFASRSYVTHNSTGGATGQFLDYAFHWRAPSSAQGSIYFFASGVNAIVNQSYSNDHALLARDTVEAYIPLSVPELEAGGVDQLRRATPNPTRGPTTLSYSLARKADARLRVFDAQGRLVRTLLSGSFEPGPGQVTWDGRREDGALAGPGVYWARLQSAGSKSPPPQRIVIAR